MAQLQEDTATAKAEKQKICEGVYWQGDFPDDITFLHDSYYGTGGFKWGDYLVPHPREVMEKYSRRQFMGYYTNYVQPCVDSFVNPIYREAPSREYKSNALFDAFLLDVDGGGTGINRFMKTLALKAKLYGGALVVLDNYAEPSESREDALKNRRFPFAYIVRPNQVTEWVLDRYGNLIKISYRLTYSEIVDGNARNMSDTWTWTAETWSRETNGMKTEGINALGKIPVIPLYGNLKDDDERTASILHTKEIKTMFPQSAYYQIARCNLAIYNACSELRERNRNQAFSILAYPIADQDDFEVAQEAVTGSNNMMLYRGSAGIPKYIDPSSIPSDILVQEIQYLVQEIYRMAERANVTGVQAQTSGLSKEWDANVGNQSIADFASSLEDLEKRLADLFGLYVGADLDFKVTYNKDYAPPDISSALSSATQALSMQTGGRFDEEVRKAAARAMFHDFDDDVLNKIMDDIQNRSEEIDRIKSEEDNE